MPLDRGRRPMIPSPYECRQGGGRDLDHLLMANALSTRSVDLVEADVLAASRRIQANRNAHQAETNRAGPNGPRHTYDYGVSLMRRRPDSTPSDHRRRGTPADRLRAARHHIPGCAAHG